MEMSSLVCCEHAGRSPRTLCRHLPPSGGVVAAVLKFYLMTSYIIPYTIILHLMLAMANVDASASTLGSCSSGRPWETSHILA